MYKTRQVVVILVRQIQTWIKLVLRPGGAVLNKDLPYKSKEPWYKFEFAEKRSLEP